MARIKNRIIKNCMQLALQCTAFFARRPRWEGFNNALLRRLAKGRANSTIKFQPGSLEELGKSWQNAFPSAKQVPLVNITEDTVYAEIHTPCPLRGSGDVNACYRMMEYDRAYLKHFGGDFVVLQSQTEPRVEVCQVAMQFLKGEKETKLLPAHKRIREMHKEVFA